MDCSKCPIEEECKKAKEEVLKVHPELDDEVKSGGYCPLIYELFGK